MSREERIREKLKFFNLETEDLKTTKKRIEDRVRTERMRFGPLDIDKGIESKDKNSKI